MKILPADRLRAVCLVDQLDVPEWVCSVLEWLRGGEFSELCAIAVTHGAHEKTPPVHVLVFHPLPEHVIGSRFDLYRRLDFERNRRRFSIRRLSSSDGEERLITLDANGSDVVQSLADIVRDAHADCIIALGTASIPPAVAKHLPLGIWEFRFGGQIRTLQWPTGFWELYRGEPFCRISLHAVHPRGGADVILAETEIRTDRQSLCRNELRLYDAAEYLLRTVVQRAAQTGKKIEVESGQVPQVNGTQDLRYPSDFEMLRYIWASARLRLSNTRERRSWGVGTMRGELMPDRFSLEGIRWIEGDDSYSLADPFIVSRGGRRVLFAERIPRDSGRGELVYLEEQENGTFDRPEQLFVRDYHCSYPFVFESDGELFLLPEEGRGGRLTLYRCTGFPADWERMRTLVRETGLVDPSLVRYADRWWLFVTRRDRIRSSKFNHSNLHIYYSDSLEGEFRPHLRNPVWTSLCGSRCAGAPFVREGKLYRPAQDCSLGYGREVIIYEVTELTPEGFQQRPVRKISPCTEGPYPDAIHTINSAHGMIVFDGARTHKDDEAKIKPSAVARRFWTTLRLMERVRSEILCGGGAATKPATKLGRISGLVRRVFLKILDRLAGVDDGGKRGGTEWRLLERRREAGRKMVGDRLAYYWQEPRSAFWDEQWKTQINERRYRSAEKGSLGELRDAFVKHLPKEGKILEAGCGPAHFVLALQVRGYDCHGIDFGEQTVAAVKAMRPALPISIGDVTHLDVADGHYRGYISLGVIEHTEAGPDKFLIEARRVLSDEGVAIIAVPNFHVLRQLKARLGLYPKAGESLSFYQYAFTWVEMAEILERHGFEVVDGYRYNCIKGLGDELPLVWAIANHPTYGTQVKRWMKKNQFLNRHCGHMLLFVCRKRSSFLATHPESPHAGSEEPVSWTLEKPYDSAPVGLLGSGQRRA